MDPSVIYSCSHSLWISTVNSTVELGNASLNSFDESVALLVASRTNNRKVAGSRPTKIVCVSQC